MQRTLEEVMASGTVDELLFTAEMVRLKLESPMREVVVHLLDKDGRQVDKSAFGGGEEVMALEWVESRTDGHLVTSDGHVDDDGYGVVVAVAGGDATTLAAVAAISDAAGLHDAIEGAKARGLDEGEALDACADAHDELAGKVLLAFMDTEIDMARYRRIVEEHVPGLFGHE